MKENEYTPPKTRTVTPSIDHLRTVPDVLHINDVERAKWFTNFNDALLKKIREVKAELL